jgi:starch-binding outer membrane protein, SusD/RagB family
MTTIRLNRNARRGGSLRRAAVSGAMVLLTLGLAACDLDSLLEVEQPFTVTPPVAQDPANLPTAFAGAVREFSRAYGGVQNNNGGIIHHSGMLADEIWHSGSFPTRREIDERNIQETNGTNAVDYQRIHLARNLTEQVAQLYESAGQGTSVNRAELLNLAGFTYIFFGENYCGGVPFSFLPLGAGETVFGEPQSTQQIFDRARARFDAAAAFATGEQLNVARIGQARALLNSGQFNEAAAAVTAVPTSFAYNVAYNVAATPTHNAVFQMINGEKRFSVWGASDVTGEGINGLPYNDPRTPKTAPGTPFEGTVPHYGQLKYPGLGTHIPLATGVEARLIEAEAALRANNIQAFVSMHNAARAHVNLAPFVLADVQAMTARQREDVHFRERAYHMWLTAHRLGDLRRLVRQYNRTIDSVFPVGISVRGEPYGNHVTLRVPFAERNNPLYNPSACDPTIP